ncbi:MAG: DUF4257 domain-containing protein [Halanaerobiales bacterium]|nr:DUF4257 domain-containing protein [Halanaerobiales bacterium]
MKLNILWIVLGGAFGGLLKAIFDGEHKLAKPIFIGKYFYLGFLGNVFIGIGAAIIGMNYLSSITEPDNVLKLNELKILATSISFGIAANSVIEGVIEKVKTKKKDIPL